MAFCCAFAFALFTAASGAGAHTRAHGSAHGGALGVVLYVRASVSECATHTRVIVMLALGNSAYTSAARRCICPAGHTLEEVQVKKKRI